MNEIRPLPYNSQGVTTIFTLEAPRPLLTVDCMLLYIYIQA